MHGNLTFDFSRIYPIGGRITQRRSSPKTGHIGAKTVNRWREDYLRDFAARMGRCGTASSP
jgi:hypothetical protein